MTTSILLPFLLLLGSSGGLDFYLMPDQFARPDSGPIQVGIHSGGFPASRNVLKLAHLDGPMIYSEDGQTMMENIHVSGKRILASAYIGAEGDIAIAVATKPSLVELSAADVARYLEEEGYDELLEQRRQKGVSGEPVHEVFTRIAKTLLHVGESNSQLTKPLGLPLEFVPLLDPFGVRPQSSLPVKVLYNEYPAVGLLVSAMSSSDSEPHVIGRTDENGTIVIPIPSGGRWLLHTVLLEQAVGDQFPAEYAVQWESFWATLTFEISDRTPSHL